MILCSKSTQWTDAYFGFGDPEGFQPLSSYSGLFPNLTTLHVHFTFVHFERWTCDVFRVAPALRKLTITGIHDIVGDRTFPWAQITGYASKDDEELQGWNGPDNSVYFRILPNLKNAETVGLDCMLLEDLLPMTPPTQLLTLSRLHTLTLHVAHVNSEGEEVGTVDQLLDWLILPLLRTPKLPEGVHDIHSLAQLLDRFLCSLQELHLVNAPLCDDQFGTLFGGNALRGPHKLDFGLFRSGSSCSVNDNVLRSLRVVPGEDVHLPQLESLALRSSKQWSDSVLVETITSRRNVGTAGVNVSRLNQFTLVNAIPNNAEAI
ncbi:hypothetical protein Moror_12032 [Moniliophthora roreri MCA 2997]|uniref:Uncharacterized protein n=1 Tax=Moniliophthora roreri (strain MCA 2997) TaxID=1381753 RepID=V2WPZ5_MONRO|nr:hypothetical protein Moror_12032 [Moniliophthora roreri MCA 2997]